MKNDRKIKIAAVAITLLLLASISGIFMLTSVNSGLEKNLNAERLKSENLLSEKLQLEKQIRNFKADISQLEGKNKELDQWLVEAKVKLGAQESKLAQLSKENTGLRNIRKEKDELQKLRDELSNKLTALSRENQSLKAEVESLNLNLDQLKKENEKLLAASKPGLNANNQALASNFRVEVRKKNEEKLTVKAKRSRSLQLSFDMPKSSAMALGTQYRVQMLSLEGKAVSGSMKDLQVSPLDGVTASLIGLPSGNEYEQVSLVYEHEGRIKDGIYTLIVYNGKILVGSAQVKLK